MSSLEDIELATVGLGHVGLPLAVGKKRRVVGLDTVQRRIDCYRTRVPNSRAGGRE
jgi:UDP-N-acetyl-D-mannosaminuronate dehydrogenase